MINETIANFTIRALAKESNVKLWEIADELGISDTTFSKMMRKELPPQKKEKAVLAIRKIKELHSEF